jgi:hypothetical protein
MPQRHPVETLYRGERYVGEWYIEDGQLHLVSPHGRMSGPAVTLSYPSSSPAGRAEGMLWRLMRSKDPKPPFFYLR